MMNALIVYFSKYGQTEAIADHIAGAIRGVSEKATVVNVDEALKLLSIQEFDSVILGSPIYATKHSKRIRKFVQRHQTALRQKKTGFFSVSLSASGDASQKQDASDCMQQFLTQLQWQPDHREIFAGSLLYRKYNWFVRWMMKRISKKAGGDTDTSRNYEYTNWKRVSEFAESFAGNEALHPNGAVATKACS